MFKIVQGTLIVTAIGLAFGAGYEMRPVRKAPLTVAPAGEPAPVSELPDSAPAVDIRMPVGEMTPIAAIPVDRKDIAFKWIEKELGINTSVLDPQEKQTFSVLQPLDGTPAARP